MAKGHKFSILTLFLVVIFILVVGGLVWVGNFEEPETPGTEMKLESETCNTECFGECVDCDSRACCLSSDDYWCCPEDKRCDYVNRDCAQTLEDCGDGTCQDEEDCSSCPGDCGMCREDIIEKISDTIVWIKYEVGGKNKDGLFFRKAATGSGVIVDNSNDRLTIYTNRHVVDCEFNSTQCFQRITENIKVRTRDGRIRKVDRVSYSEAGIDLAVLRIQTDEAEDYEAASYEEDFEEGDDVIAIGYPGYAENIVEFSVSEGNITETKKVLSQRTGTEFKVIESNAYTHFGSSGGGLFDEEGNLVGINTWGRDEQSIAIDFSSISEEKFVYCGQDSYYSNGGCFPYCERDEVRGYESRRCYDVCEGFYCNSEKPDATDPVCGREGYLLGEDGYCHPACGSGICPDDSVCFNNECRQCSRGVLWKDGTCRFLD